MAMFFGGVTSDSVGSLFSSLNGTNQTSTILSDYYSIKSGSYKKLLNAYYAKVEGEDTKKTDSGTVSSKIDYLNGSQSTSTARDNTKVLKQIEESSVALKDAANALVTKGTNSLFDAERVTNSEGKSELVYDTAKIYDGVKKFVESYNGVIEATENSNTKSIASNYKILTNNTKVNASALSEIGITINEDNTLSLDETKFKNADMSSVKSLFNGTGSYGYRTSATASMVNFNAEYEATRANTYTNTGSYTNNYNTGYLYDSLF